MPLLLCPVQLHHVETLLCASDIVLIYIPWPSNQVYLRCVLANAACWMQARCSKDTSLRASKPGFPVLCIRTMQKKQLGWPDEGAPKQKRAPQFTTQPQWKLRAGAPCTDTAFFLKPHWQKTSSCTSKEFGVVANGRGSWLAPLLEHSTVSYTKIWSWLPCSSAIPK